MQDGSIEIIVQRITDIQIVYWILEAAEYPIKSIKITTIENKRLKSFLNGLSPGIGSSCAVLVNIQAKTVQDAVTTARQHLDNPPVEVFCAIPEVEAWLFADELTAQENAATSYWIDVLSTLPLPEDIKSPKSHAERAFGKKVEAWEFIKTINNKRCTFDRQTYSLRICVSYRS